MALRWRERVRAAEQVRYGRGLIGAASQLAVERRMPTTRRAPRPPGGARRRLHRRDRPATVLLVFAAAVAVVAEAVLSAL